MKYQEIRDQLQTGDIVLFSGTNIISKLVKLTTGSDFSHIGMIVRISGFDTVFLWESTTLSNTKDFETGKATKGVQFVELSRRIDAYKGKIAVRHLNKGLDPEQLVTLGDLRKEFRGRPYEESNIELAISALDFLSVQNKEDLSSLFCSEMVAEVYQRMMLLGEGKTSNEYTPADFANSLTLLNGFELGELIPIT